MERPLAGSIAIVTGASRGLGRAFALDLAQCGAALTLVSRNADSLADAANAVRSFGVPCETIIGDVRDDTLATHAVAHTIDRLGPPTMLVNNAGVSRLGALVDVDIDDWWDVLTVNLRAPVAWTKAVVPVMQAQGRGRIINVSSPATTAPLPYISSYGAAKAGLSQFTACIAPEVATDGIVVVAIGPTALTDMTRSLWETGEERCFRVASQTDLANAALNDAKMKRYKYAVITNRTTGVSKTFTIAY